MTQSRCARGVMLWLALAAPRAIAQDLAQETVLDGIHAAGDGRIEAVRFDTVLILDGPIASTRIALFVRHVVSAERQRVRVRWVEPHWAAINFTRYPVTLTIDSEPETITLTQSLYPASTRVFRRPLPARPVFHHVANGYSLPDLAWCDEQQRTARVLVDDLFAFRDQSDTFHTGRLAGRFHDRQLATLTLPATPDRSRRHLTYEYESGRLSRLLVRDSAIRIPAGGVRGTIRRTSARGGSSRTDVGAYTVEHHRGGRTTAIRFADVALGPHAARLPTQLRTTATSAAAFLTPGQFLRSARFLDYQPLDHIDHRTVRSPQDVVLSPEYRLAVQLMNRYWHATTPVSDEDTGRLRSGLRHFQGRFRHTQDPVERLVCLRVQIMHHTLLHSSPRIMHELMGSYMQHLVAASAGEMLVEAGASLLRLLSRRYPPQIVRELSAVWCEAVISSADAADILAMLRRRRLEPEMLPLMRRLSEQHSSAPLGEPLACELAIHLLRLRQHIGSTQRPSRREISALRDRYRHLAPPDRDRLRPYFLAATISPPETIDGSPQ